MGYIKMIFNASLLLSTFRDCIEIYSQLLTINCETVKLDKHVFLVPIQPGIAPLIKLGCDENSACPLPLGSAVVCGNGVREWGVLQVGEASEDGTSGLKVHAARQVHIGLLPEGVQLVRLSVVRLNLAVRYSHTIVVQLKW